MGTIHCEHLDWDSEFFGCRIARVVVPCLTEISIAQIEAWCATERIDCLYLLVDSSDIKTARIAEEKSFRLVDIRITLGLSAMDIGAGVDSSSCKIRDATENDIPVLRAIARDAHRDSRFYYDRRFPKEKCDELFETWIEKSCRGWAAKVIVADEGNGAEGYLTCHTEPSGRGQIRLVGVAERARGRGLGSRLVKGGTQWFAKNGAIEISVATQGRNISAQRLYQKHGFAPLSVGVWFHRWFSDDKKDK
jgi:GNAT superfamily N-acetyltransferase